MRRALLLPVLLTIALAGCAAQPAAESTAEPAPPPTDAATAQPTASTADLPDCEELLTIEQARALFSEQTEAIGGDAVAESLLLGPLDGAPTRTCVWGIPSSDGAFTITVTIADADQAAGMRQSLKAAGLVAGDLDGNPTYSFATETELGGMFEEHRVLGSTWIMAQAPSSGTASGAADAAAAAVLAP
jgi:hypothetical protein